MTKRKSVLITRPEPGATYMATYLSEMGYSCQCFSLTQNIGLVPFFPFGNFTALLATSAKAFEFLTQATAAEILDLPLYCIGEKTKDAALKFGHREEIISYSHVTDLLENGLPAHKQNFLYLAGKVRRQILEISIKERQHNLEIVEIYDTIPTQKALRHCQHIDTDIILVSSSFCAFLLNNLANYFPEKTKILCFSKRIKDYLSPILRRRASVLAKINKDSICEALKAL